MLKEMPAYAFSDAYDSVLQDAVADKTNIELTHDPY